MRLSVKGTREQIEKAMRDHGIDPNKATWIKEYSRGNITPDPWAAIEVENDNQLAATRWYNETVGSPPYPPGTLLLFTGLE